MKTIHVLRLAVALATMLPVAASVGATESTASGKPALKPGMSAEEVIKTIGEPRSVTKLKSGDGIAEKWTYHRRLRTDTSSEPVRTETLPAYLGPGLGDKGMGTVEVPVYRLRHTTFTQVTALLMVNGELVTARQWVEQDVDYEG